MKEKQNNHKTNQEQAAKQTKQANNRKPPNQESQTKTHTQENQEFSRVDWDRPEQVSVPINVGRSRC